MSLSTEDLISENTRLRAELEAFSHRRDAPLPDVQAKMFRLLGEADLGLLVVDSDLHIVEFNQKASEILNVDFIAVAKATLDEYFTFCNENLRIVKLANYLANADKLADLSETFYVSLPSAPEVGKWIKIKIRNISGLARENQLILLIEDIDREKKKAIQHRQVLQLEHVVTDISTRFVHLDDDEIDPEISFALATIGMLTEVDRAYVFLYSPDGETMSNTHEWCNEGVSQEIDKLQNLPVSIFPWWNTKIKNTEEIYLYDLNELPENASKEKEILVAQSIASLLVVPIVKSGKSTGFLGFDSVKAHKKWTETDIRLLRLVAELFGNTFRNREARATLIKSEERYRSLVESTDAVVLVVDNSGMYHYANLLALQFLNTPTDIVGQSIFDFFPEKFAGHLLNQVRAVLNTGENIKEETVFDVNNEKRWFRIKLQPIFEEHKNVDKVLIYAEDINEEKNNKIQLERLNQRLEGLHSIDRVIMEQLTTGDDISELALLQLYELISCEIIIYATLNYVLGQVEIAKHIARGNLITPDVKSVRFDQFDFALLENGKAINKTYTADNLSCSYYELLYERGIRSSLSIPVSLDGQIIGIIVLLSFQPDFFSAELIELAEDVGCQLRIGIHQVKLTEQIKNYNQKLEELVESRTRERNDLSKLNLAIVETTGVAIISSDEQGRIKTFNPMAERLLGYNSGDIIDEKFISGFYDKAELSRIKNEVLSKDQLEQIDDFSAIIRYAEMNYPTPLDCSLLRRDGSPVPVLLSISSNTENNRSSSQYIYVATDISQLKIAEEALELQVSAFESFAYALIITDINGTVLWANNSYVQLSGFTFIEILGNKIGKLQRSGMHDTLFYKNMWQTILNGEVWKGEVYNKRKDGSLYLEELTITPVRNSRGEIINFVAIKIDITAERKAEELQRETERINLAILNSVPDLLFRIDKNGKLLDVYNSDASNPILPLGPFVENNISEFLPDEIVSKSLSALSEAFQTKALVSLEYEIEINHKPRYLENRIVAISDLEALSIIRDDTDRTLAEQSLKSTMIQLNTLVENMQIGTLFEDKKRRILLVNQYFCDMFGIPLTPPMLNGFDCAQAAHSSAELMIDPEGFISRIDQILSGNQIVTNDELHLRDGRFFERDFVPIKSADGLLGYLWQYRDITPRKLNEKYGFIQRDLGFSLATTSTMSEALESVVKSTSEIDSVEEIGIYLFNSETNRLELMTGYGVSDDRPESVKSYEAGTPQFEYVFGGTPLYGSAKKLAPGLAFLSGQTISQIGIIPIKQENLVIGSLHVGTSLDKAFTNATKIALEAIAAQIGGALSRIKTQKELNLSQNNFQLMFDTIQDFVFILDTGGNIIKTNPVVEQRLGYTRDELSGMSVLNVHPAEQREEVAFLIGQMLEKKIETCPVPLCTKGGERIPVETKVVPGKWDGKDALYAISRDISERIKAQETLRNSEARWQFALESSGDGIWDWDVASNTVFFSRQWKKMLGYEDDEIPNLLTEWESRIYPDDLEQVLNDLEEHFKGNAPIFQNEHRVLCRDGSYKWILDRGKVIASDEAGKPLRLIGTHTDISSRKNYEISLAEALQKEKELNELKSRFVSMASHEFRTPLSNILVAAETLDYYIDRLPRADVSKKIERIKNNVDFLKNVIEKVLNLSHLESGRIKFAPQKSAVCKFITSIVDEFQTSTGLKRRIDFKCHKKELVASIDEQMIKQVILNLLNNSVKFSSEGSKIGVDLSCDASNLILKITDEGIGIPKEDRDKIFDPFHRGSNVGNIRGTGLGLPLSKQFVALHHGQITFHSVGNKGTTFVVTLPL